MQKITVLVVLCVMLKQCLAFFSPFALGYKSVWKIKHRQTQYLELSMQERLSSPQILSYVSVILSYLCFSYLTFSNPHLYPGMCKPTDAKIMAEVNPKSGS